VRKHKISDHVQIYFEITLASYNNNGSIIPASHQIFRLVFFPFWPRRTVFRSQHDA